jgi:acetyl/propionyl-CoA carboxylase alpha subunit
MFKMKENLTEDTSKMESKKVICMRKGVKVLIKAEPGGGRKGIISWDMGHGTWDMGYFERSYEQTKSTI